MHTITSPNTTKNAIPAVPTTTATPYVIYAIRQVHKNQLERFGNYVNKMSRM